MISASKILQQLEEASRQSGAMWDFYRATTMEIYPHPDNILMLRGVGSGVTWHTAKTKCSYCGQWGEPYQACEYCGAPN